MNEGIRVTLSLNQKIGLWSRIWHSLPLLEGDSWLVRRCVHRDCWLGKQPTLRQPLLPNPRRLPGPVTALHHRRSRLVAVRLGCPGTGPRPSTPQGVSRGQGTPRRECQGRGGKCGHWDWRPRTPARAGRGGQGWGGPAGGAAWAGSAARTCRAAAAVGARRGQRKAPGRWAQVSGRCGLGSRTARGPGRGRGLGQESRRGRTAQGWGRPIGKPPERARVSGRRRPRDENCCVPGQSGGPCGRARASKCEAPALHRAPRIPGHPAPDGSCLAQRQVGPTSPWALSALPSAPVSANPQMRRARDSPSARKPGIQ